MHSRSDEMASGVLGFQGSLPPSVRTVDSTPLEKTPVIGPRPPNPNP